MARYNTLGAMVERLRLEVRDSPNVAHQPDWLPVMKAALRTAQETLWLTETWPFLRVRVSAALTAGTRYLTIPAGINWEGIRQISVAWGGDLSPVEFGITDEHRMQWDSDADERSSPVSHWDVDAGSGVERLELWPIPDANDQTLKIVANKPLPSFVNDGDQCALDDTLVILFAAAKLLAGRSAKDAEAKAAEARAHLELVRGASKKTAMGRYNFAGDTSARRPGRLLAPR